MSSCIRKTKKFLSIIKAIISRSLFVFHGLISIWRVTQIKRSHAYWFLSGTLPLMLAETIYTLCRKKDSEWKWICPSVVLYLATSVPAIWFLELDLMRQRIMMGAVRHPIINNSRNVFMLNGKMIKIPIALGSEEWCKILEQLLLLILIIGRWLLPKGEITREQLSQLLLVYIGMAADIIELFEAFKEQTVRENTLLTIVILSLWTASLTQFTLVITATKAKKTRITTMDRTSSENACCPTEVISILISVFLQDAPFLVLRLLLIFRYDVLSYTNIFFTCKNSLVLVLQFYRLIVLFTIRTGNDSAQVPTPVTFQSYTSSDTSRDAYMSAESSDESSSSDKMSSIDRRSRKQSQRRRKTLHEFNERSSKTYPRITNGTDSRITLEDEFRKSKSKKSEHRSKASLIVKLTRPDSETTIPTSSNQNKMKVKEEKKFKFQAKRSDDIFTENREKDGRTGKIRQKDKSRQGKVQRQIKKFENSEPVIFSDTSDPVISEDSLVYINRKHKDKEMYTMGGHEVRSESPKTDREANEHYRTAKNKVRVKNHNTNKNQRHEDSMKNLQSTMSHLNGNGKYKTVVVKSDEEGKLMYVIN